MLDDYTREFTVGQEGNVILSIGNSEHKPMTYRVDVILDGAIVNSIQGIALAPGAKWQQEVTFTPMQSGDHQRLSLHYTVMVKPNLT